MPIIKMSIVDGIRPGSDSGLACALLALFLHSRVLMYLDDLPPPHVHVKLRDGRDCTIDLENLEIRGRVAEREIRDALLWIQSQKIDLLSKWQRSRS